MAMVPPEGVATDLSHIEKPCKVEGVAVDPAKPATEPELKGSIGEGPNQKNYSDRSSVRILTKFSDFSLEN